MYLIRTPNFIQSLFPTFVWRQTTDEKVLYLTFDDGPVPEVTPWVLDLLKRYNAKATFFCVGENVNLYPGVFQRVIDAGHTVGNHTYNHLSGWATENNQYVDNISQCTELVDSDLFRPPYGRIKPSQVCTVQHHYKIVMWDVLSADFDPEITPKQCNDNVIDNATPGSIIVFHDNTKAIENLQYALPRVLDHFAKAGFTFMALEQQAVVSDRQLEDVA